MSGPFLDARARARNAHSSAQALPQPPFSSWALAAAVAAAALAVVTACAGAPQDTRTGEEPERGPGATAQAPTAACPPHALSPERMPGVEPQHETLSYWLQRYAATQLDEPLMSAEAIAEYNAALGRRPHEHVASQRDLLEPISASLLRRELHERLAFVRTRIADGRYVDAAGARVEVSAHPALSAALPESFSPELRVALADIPMRCGPYPGPLYEPNAAIRYDRNACSVLRAQDPVLVLGNFGPSMLAAQTRYARGFIDAGVALSPPVPTKLAETIVHGARAVLSAEAQVRDAQGKPQALPAGTLLPLASAAQQVWLATAAGLEQIEAPATLTPTRRPLTRRALLTEAFSLLGTPYGFGDAGGGRDCSRLLLDVFERFDLALPRFSGWQAQAGRFTLDVRDLSDADKTRAIRLAGERAAVVLAFPGHVMLHLGEREDGAPMVLHALGEYVRPCGNGGETVLENKRVLVSDLELGRGTSRKALLQRVTTLVLLGEPPRDPALAAQTKPTLAAPPSAPPADAPCADSLHARVFTAPQRPERDRSLRVMATATAAGERSELWLFDPSGQRVRAPLHRLGGPPFTVWLELEEPLEGRYTALWTDGEKTLACRRIVVRAPQKPEPSSEGGVWEPRFRWEADTHNLWSAFVEQLFDDPIDSERTWTSLHELLRERGRNLLHDHFGLGEERAFDLVPDCADLPYALRAYFAWKLKLPFGYRQCSRGRSGVPPTCGELKPCTMPREDPDDVRAFDRFVNRRVRSGVHSASGRTHPSDDATDLYPVALNRASLPPGTVFADPYGHVLILTKWIPQGQAGSSYGILMAAEAQPDNTVGRRRFSRGTFLFDPSTEDVGAGFKQFRPLVFDRKTGTLTPLDNAALAQTREHARFNLEQYEGDRDAFYDRMDALINPQPLDPSERLRSVLDSFEEAVTRRVLAIETGQAYVRAHPKPVPMPIGHEVFETTGPWEDYSTPSRDLRLLIVLDELLGLPKRVEAQPERFGLSKEPSPAQRVEQLRSELRAELARRTFTYARSDGSTQRLPLSAVVERADALEVGYNPNDCPELRWGAPAGSDEAATCKRRAPKDQRDRMERYRVWFHSRTRPARGARGP